MSLPISALSAAPGSGHWRRALRLLMAVCAVTITGVAFADTDLDGVADDIDNCVLVANPQQRDSDVDGYGNRCDPDFNNDLVVNVVDLGELRLAFFSAAAEQDLNGDGVVNVLDLGLLRSYMFGPPGPGAPDIDNDGIPLAEDRCPNSPRNSASVEDGCSAFDIAHNPERVFDVDGQSERLVAEMTEVPELAFFTNQLNDGVSQLRQSIARMKAGEACAAMDDYWQGFETLVNAHTDMAGFVTEFEFTLANNPPFTAEQCQNGGPSECEFGADHTTEDTALLNYQYLRTALFEIAQYVEGRGGVLNSACNGITGTLFKGGRIVFIDDSARRIELYDEAQEEYFTVGITDDVNIVGEVYLGRNVRVVGQSYQADAGILDAIVPLAVPTPQVGLAYDSCAVLRIAPVQRFAPFNTAPYELHEPNAYLYETGRLRLEKGMAFATVDSFFGCPDGNDTHTVYYSQKLTLEFENSSTGNVETRVLAMGMSANGQPVPLPDEISHGSEATLTVEFYRQTCPRPTPGVFARICSERERYRTDTYELSVWARQTFCRAIYNEEAFELEDTGQTEFRSATIDDRQTLLVAPDSGTTMSIVAEGYAINGNTSSYPAITTVTEGQPFAMYKHDCVTQEGQLFGLATCGTTKPSGLRWPRLVGQRNGRTFSYSCKLPDIIRDLRDYCPNSPDAFFKFPFRGSSPEWRLSQGNFGEFTHNGNQSFAFDFVADAGTTIRAARRGEVVFVREDQTGNSYFSPGCTNCMANVVTLRHEDGMLSDYVHLPTNGALVTQGQFVERGQAIGLVGNTGFSTGPHLHWTARNSGSTVTTRVRFEALDNGLTDPPFTCWIPQSGDSLASDN